MTVEGSLDLFQVPEILQVVSQQRKTGILTIQGPSDIVAVSFLEGRIVAADSLTETTEEGLGEVLVADGLVEASTLRRLAGRSGDGGPRLGDLLVSEGHIDREQLLDALRTHTMLLLMGLVDWRAGQFKFYGGDEVSYEEGFRSIGVDELLLRAVEEQGRESLPEPGARMERRTPDRPVQVRDLSEEGGLGALGGEDVIWLTPEEERVLDEVGPDRPVYEIAQAVRVPLDRVRYTLYRLAREGLVGEVARAPAEPTVREFSVEEGSAPGPTPAAAPGAAAMEPPAATPSVPREEPTLEPERPRPEELQEAPEAAPPRRKRPPAVAAGRELPITGLLAVVLVTLLVGAVVLAPASVLRPFPWLGEERAAHHETHDALLLLKIDRAARTFFLHEGRFPDRLEELVDRGLLAEEDMVDSTGRRLGYDAAEGSYRIEPMTATEGTRTVREGVAGDFLLDPEFLVGRGGAAEEPPLVLLD